MGRLWASIRHLADGVHEHRPAWEVPVVTPWLHRAGATASGVVLRAGVALGAGMVMAAAGVVPLGGVAVAQVMVPGVLAADEGPGGGTDGRGSGGEGQEERRGAEREAESSGERSGRGAGDTSGGRTGSGAASGPQAQSRARLGNGPDGREQGPPESRTDSVARPGVASRSPSPSADPSRAGSRPGEGRERPGRQDAEKEETPREREREDRDRREAEEPDVGVAPWQPGREAHPDAPDSEDFEDTEHAGTVSGAPGTGGPVPETEATASGETAVASPDAVAGPGSGVEPVKRIVPLGSGLVLIGLGLGLAFLGLRLRRG
ncbi:hypothetical protein GCM10009535_55820 [Streptomyces thermocarboxydovorans]|uniref:Uncharacterized protein n=1 Tax=Streptomyces thermocarboxydovorans TaxID=59298 RepID=A0ABN1HV38_9ACTN